MTSVSERNSRPKPFELDGRLYLWLGVVPFKRALMGMARTDPRRPTVNAYFLAGRTLEDVRAFEPKSRRSEIVHEVGVLFALTMLALGLALQRPPLWIPGMVALAANLHCFILQRYDLIRVHRLLDRSRRSGQPELTG